MSVKLKDLIKKMLSSEEGVVVEERDDEFIWVHSQDAGIGIFQIIEDHTVTEEDVVVFARNTEQIKGFKGLICIKNYDKSAEKAAEKLNIQLLSREKIAELIGEFIIRSYESGEDLHMFEEEDIEVEDIEFFDEEEEVWEEEDVIPIIIEDVGGEEKIIKINIDKERAITIARKKISVMDITLKLIPYFLFEYSLKVIIEGTMEERFSSGIIAIDGETGKYEIWKMGYETTSKIEIQHVRVEPLISLEKAKSAAVDGLKKEYTREKEITLDDSTVTIIEKRKMRPLESSIKTNYMGLYYLPVWEATGKEGKVRINAATGEIISLKRKATI